MNGAVKIKVNAAPLQSNPSYLWFIAQESIMKGPYTTHQLEEKINKRDFSPFDYCWRQGFKEWRPIASVQDIHHSHPLEDLPPYPQLETPGNYRGINMNGPAINESPVIEPRVLRNGFFQKKPRAYVNFKTGRRAAWSIYEWAAAVILATVVSFIVTTLSLNEVKRKFFQRWEMTQAGSPQLLGDQHLEGAIHPIFWAPIASAPGLLPLTTQDVSGLNPNAPKLDLQLPVTIFGNPAVPAGNNTEIVQEGMSYGVKGSLELWNPARFELDSIYIRPVELKGYLSLENNKEIWVHNPSHFIK